MNNAGIEEIVLRKLIDDNFKMARHCRKVTEALTDVSLKHFYQNIASRRSRFAMELADEISFFTGKKPYHPTQIFDRERKEINGEEQLHIIKKTLKLAKRDLQSYQEALCRIHLGSFREILLRHKAFIENSIFELKSIKTILKFQDQEKGRFKEESSH